VAAAYLLAVAALLVITVSGVSGGVPV